jgi:membrane protein involved in colicin uptake
LAQHRLEQECLEKERLEQQRLEQIQLTQENEQERQAQEERLQRERQAQDDAAIALLEQERAIAKQAHLAKQANPPQQATQLSTGSIEVANHKLDEQAQSTDTATSDITIERHRSEMVYAIDHTDTADNIAEPLADDPTAAVLTHETSVTDPLADIDNPSIATTPAIEQIKQDIVKQLQGYIDNYLLESMTLMNEDLNQWLKTEVEKQLTVRLSQSH